MGSLISSIAAVSSAVYGVNVLEQDPPGGVRGTGTNVVAAVANLPWGPVDAVTEITSPAEFFATFAPTVFDDGTTAGMLNSWPALKAFVNKTFPNTVKVARISPTSQATATRTFDDASAGDSVKVDAKYPGALGNQIKIAWAANADDATARDATVSIGTAYSVTYKNVATIVATALVVTDPGDPYVTFSKASGATLVPAAASATALATGADGTEASGDYGTCIDLFAAADAAFSVGFCAEPGAAVVDAVNDLLETFVNTHGRGFWVLSTPAAQSASTALTYAASRRSDRLLYPWPRVKMANPFDPDRAEVTVDGAAFAAVAVASVQPEESPGGAPGAPYLRGITALEASATRIQLESLRAGGVTPFFMSGAMGGAILYDARTTSLTSGREKVFRRRMTDFLLQSAAAYLEPFTGTKLDIDLAGRRLGPVTDAEIGGLVAFLEGLKQTERIRDYSVDPFGGNLQDNIDAGQFIILMPVKLFSVQEEIILKATIGESVNITSAA
ncbi:MAG: Phage tail sheath protein beta-sandwich domain [Pseudomonadota bacterium]